MRYDIYGPDVMIANKMESNGETGKVMISETTMAILQENYSENYAFTKGNDVYIKHFHKNIEGYFVNESTHSHNNIYSFCNSNEQQPFKQQQ